MLFKCPESSFRATPMKSFPTPLVHPTFTGHPLSNIIRVLLSLSRLWGGIQKDFITLLFLFLVSIFLFPNGYNQQFYFLKLPFNTLFFSLVFNVTSFGIVMWEIGSRQVPFGHSRDAHEIAHLVASIGIRPDLGLLQACIPTAYRELLVHAWDQSPQHRPTFRDIAKSLEKMQPSQQPFATPDFRNREAESIQTVENNRGSSSSFGTEERGDSLRYKSYGLRRLFGSGRKERADQAALELLVVTDKGSDSHVWGRKGVVLLGSWWLFIELYNILNCPYKYKLSESLQLHKYICTKDERAEQNISLSSVIIIFK